MFLLTHQRVSLSVPLLSLTDEDLFDLDSMCVCFHVNAEETRVGPVSSAENWSGVGGHCDSIIWDPPPYNY